MGMCCGRGRASGNQASGFCSSPCTTHELQTFHTKSFADDTPISLPWIDLLSCCFLITKLLVCFTLKMWISELPSKVLCWGYSLVPTSILSHLNTPYSLPHESLCVHLSALTPSVWIPGAPSSGIRLAWPDLPHRGLLGVRRASLICCVFVSCSLGRGHKTRMWASLGQGFCLFHCYIRTLGRVPETWQVPDNEWMNEWLFGAP